MAIGLPFERPNVAIADCGCRNERPVKAIKTSGQNVKSPESTRNSTEKWFQPRGLDDPDKRNCQSSKHLHSDEHDGKAFIINAVFGCDDAQKHRISGRPLEVEATLSLGQFEFAVRERRESTGSRRRIAG
jgi:hypothetical protein